MWQKAKYITRIVVGSSFLILILLLNSPANMADFEWITKDRIGNANAKIVINWAVRPEYSHQQSLTERVDYLVERFEEWARKNPEVQIKVELLPTAFDLHHARLLEQAARGEAPDIAQIDPQYAVVFHPFLQPLNQYFTKKELEDFFPVCFKGVMVDKQRNIKNPWFVINMEGLWYRKDIIKNPPKTWDEVITMSKWLMKEKGFPIGFEYGGRGVTIVFGSILPMFFAQGGVLTDEDGNPVFNQGKNREILIRIFEFYKKTIETGITPLNIVNNETIDDRIANPLANKVAMLIGGTWFQNYFNNALGKDQFEKKWAFTYIPQMTTDQKACVIGGWTWGIFTKDPIKQAYCINFLKHVYLGPEGMAGWCQAAKYLPCRKSVYANYRYFYEDSVTKVVAEMLNYGYLQPSVKSYPIISQQLQIAFQEVLLGQKTPQKALDAAEQRVKLEV